MDLKQSPRNLVLVSALLSTAVASAAPMTLKFEDAMVLVPAGAFAQGSPVDELGFRESNGPVHEVSLKAFYLSRHEVTIAEFRQFVEETGYVTDAERNTPISSNPADGCFSHSKPGEPSADWVPGRSWRNPGFAQSETHPVVCVSWNDAKAYTQWLAERTQRKYRLPTESEFEYALRAGSHGSHAWPLNSDACVFNNHADKSLRGVFPTWEAETSLCSDKYAFSAPVESYRVNSFGIHDLSGNVLEWTEDCWHNSYQDAPTDGSAWQSKPDEACHARVLRGGDFVGSVAQLRAAHRTYIPEAFRTYHAGFRVAREQ